MSDSGFYTGRDALNDRYLRMIEVLIAVSRDSSIPYDMVLAWLDTSGSSEEKNHEVPLNRGNSRRTMKIYLQDWALAKCGHFYKRDQFILSERGIKKVKHESGRLGKFLRQVDWSKMTDEVKQVITKYDEEEK